MADLDAIRIAIVPKGAHSASQAYSFLDIVKYNGKSYICKVFAGITAKAFDAADWFELCSDGAKGDAATIEVGTVTTGEAGSDASVVNVGTLSAAKLNITIPRGATGLTGATGATGMAGGRWYNGTAITGTATTDTVFSGSGITAAVVGDMYLNTGTYNVYRCTVAGAAAVAKWVYVCNIKGATGATGAKGTTGDTGPRGAGIISATLNANGQLILTTD